MSTKKVERYLIIDSALNMRVVTRIGRKLKPTEMAFVLEVNVPTAWGTIVTPRVTVDVPDTTPSINVRAAVQAKYAGDDEDEDDEEDDDYWEDEEDDDE